jgi:hypothetical protein
MSNLVKSHENSVTSANHADEVNAILSNVENTPYALRGATVKTILYFLFSLVAAVELSAALFFYVVSLGVSKSVAMVVCAALAFAFHGLLHSILTDTAKGVVFGKRTESGAMSNEVTANIVLSIVLLLMASCSVYFIGKKGFTAYRATQFETSKAEQVKPKSDGITANMLTSKSGKIAAYKLEMLTDLEKAKAKTTDAEMTKANTEGSRYDATTATITDIVGASAFLIELLLFLLAYTIATAKKAAVIEEIAKRSEITAKSNTTASVTDAVTASVVKPSLSPMQKQIGFSDNEGRMVVRGFTRQDTDDITASVDNSKLRICLHCEKEYIYKIHNQKFCTEICRVSNWENKAGRTLRTAKK